MKILSWNVNGIRAAVKKGFLDFLKKEKPDILLLQEIKISDAAREKEKDKFSAQGGPLQKGGQAAVGWDFSGYEEYWNSAQRPGYSGTAILVREKKEPGFGYPKPGSFFSSGFGIKKFDVEGRVQTLDMGKFYLVNAYFPHANHELTRLKFKLEFNEAFLKYVNKLAKKKPVIIGGDLNVAHEEIDLARPKDNVGNPGFTDEERAWMTKFLNKGFIDTFRNHYPKKVQYSWWSYRFNARLRNIGWRIDYFIVSAKLRNRVRNAYILDKTTGSDHCPVGLKIKD